MTQDRLLSRQRGVTIWLVLIILILAAVIGAGGWWGWQEYQRLQSDKAGFAEQLQTLTSQMAS